MKNRKIFLTALLSTLSILNSCSFMEKPTIIKKIKVNGKYDEIIVKQSMSNATTNESIQLWTNEEQLNVFERYDIYEGEYIVKDSLFIILVDTSGYQPKKDTLSIKLY